MKKLYSVLFLIVLLMIISGCKREEEGRFDKPDGQYFAIQDEVKEDFVNWTVVTIKNKRITDVEWNSYHIDGGASRCYGENKYDCSKIGLYGMDKVASKGAWYEQADKTTDWIVENQKVKNELSFQKGVADAITSVTMKTEDFFELVDEALNSEAIAEGNYAKDGYYYIETERKPSKAYSYVKGDVNGNVDENNIQLIQGAEGDYEAYSFGTFIIVNGTIVYADFNDRYTLYDFKMDENSNFILYNEKRIVLCNEDGTPVNEYLTKDPAQENYGMRNSGGEWYVQANNVEEKLLADQSLNITIDSETHKGTIDGLSNVTMGYSVAAFKLILDELNTQAK